MWRTSQSISLYDNSYIETFTQKLALLRLSQLLFNLLNLAKYNKCFEREWHNTFLQSNPKEFEN